MNALLPPRFPSQLFHPELSNAAIKVVQQPLMIDVHLWQSLVAPDRLPSLVALDKVVDRLTINDQFELQPDTAG